MLYVHALQRTEGQLPLPSQNLLALRCYLGSIVNNHELRVAQDVAMLAASVLKRAHVAA